MHPTGHRLLDAPGYFQNAERWLANSLITGFGMATRWRCRYGGHDSTEALCPALKIPSAR